MDEKIKNPAPARAAVEEAGKVALKDLDVQGITALVVSLSEKPFRARQIAEWLFQHNVSSFEQMTNLPKAFRNKLRQHALIDTLSPAYEQRSQTDGTRKFLFRLRDGLKIESVLMFDEERVTLCISTQVGCALDCRFCATGLMGLQRHLTPGEIIDQVLLSERIAGVRITNLVVMGMGEPLHNYDNLMQALSVLTSPQGFALSKKRVVVSTSGLVAKIERLIAEGRKYRLAISLNATTDAMRSKLMPVNQRWPISELLAAARNYADASKTRITIEYVLLDGMNDTPEDARRLMKLVTGLRCKVNLIPYNTTYREFARPAEERILRFYREMKNCPVPVTIRWSKGRDIDAACGQLITKEQGT